MFQNLSLEQFPEHSTRETAVYALRKRAKNLNNILFLIQNYC